MGGIFQGRALATESHASQQQSETTQKVPTASQQATATTEQPKTNPKPPDQVLDWKALDARLAALPEDQRRAALEALQTSGLSTADRRTYVELLHKLVPQAEQAAALSHLVSEVPVNLGRAEVGNFNFTHAYFMLAGYPKNKGNDELISGFIKVVTERATDPRIGCVAGMIQDPVLQKEASDRIARSFDLHPFNFGC